MNQNKLRIAAVFCMLLLRVSPGAAEVAVYTGPSGYRSSVYTVRVMQDGVSHSSFVYSSKNPWTGWPLTVMTDYNHWTTFSFHGPITVEVTKLTGDVGSCEIRPLARAITPTVEGNTVTFTLSRPAKLFVKMAGEYENPLFLFADASEVNPPDPDAPNVRKVNPGDTAPSTFSEDILYFMPGVHRIGMRFPVQANRSYYLAGGSYVIGTMAGYRTDNIKVYGRGIISEIGQPQMGDWAFYGTGGILINLEGPGTNQTVEGITFTDPPTFCLWSYSGQLICRNCKMFGWWYTTDGFGGNNNSSIQDCFFKVNDDVIKPYNDNNQARDLVIYQQMNGAPFQFSWGPDSGSNGTIDNIDVVQCDVPPSTDLYGRNHALINAVQGNGQSRISNFKFSNIRIDEDISQIIGINTAGSLRNFTISNVTVRGHQRSDSYLGTGTVSDIRFENLIIAGRCVTNGEDIRLHARGNVNNISFVCEAVPTAPTLVSHYGFEGSVADISAHGRNGVPEGNVEYAPGLTGGQAIRLDGIDGSVRIPCAIRDDFTITFWVRTRSTGTSGGVSQWYGGTGLVDGYRAPQADDFGVSVLNGRLAFGVGRPDTTLTSQRLLSDGVWHHVAATRRVATGEMRVYIDAAPEGSLLGPPGSKGGSPDLCVGSLRTGSGFLAGDIDDLRLYNYVLDSDAIVALGDIRPPAPNPATFDLPPKAVGAARVTMRATTGRDVGPIEYRFRETTGHAGGADSGWQKNPTYTNTGLRPGTGYAYTVQMRDSLGNLTAASAPVTVATCKETDINGDGVVDLFDFALLGYEWGRVQSPDQAAIATDVDNDGRVAAGDLSGLVSDWLAPLPRPVGWWRFEDGPGTVAHDSVGHSHGTLHNMASNAWVAGTLGTALSFDGIDDYVEIPRVVEKDFTITFWVKTASAGGTGTNWWSGQGLVDGYAGRNRNDFGVSLNTSAISFGIGGGMSTTVKSRTAVDDNRWHLVACTRDSITGRIQVYVDGRLEAYGTAPTGVKDASDYLTIGALATRRPGQFFKGIIDDVRIYDRVLTSGDIGGLVQSVRQPDVTLECPVLDSADDACAPFASTGTQELTQKYLYVGAHHVGLRFRNVQIPKGATIKRATLKVFCVSDLMATAAVDGVLKGEAADNPASFGADTRIVSELPTTKAAKDWKWTPATPWKKSTWFESPDLSAIVQEIVNRAKWSPNNALVILYLMNSGSEGDRAFYAFDAGNPAAAARLIITYQP